MKKPGWKTTEFWAAMFAEVLTVAVPVILPAIESQVPPGTASVIYAVVRSLVKAKNG